MGKDKAAEKDHLEKVYKMATESLEPQQFEQFEEALRVLAKTRHIVCSVFEEVYYQCKCGETIESNNSADEHFILCPKCKRTGRAERLPF